MRSVWSFASRWRTRATRWSRRATVARAGRVRPRRARPGAPGPAPARHPGLRRLPHDPDREHRADHHRHGPDRHPRPRGRPRGRRRRLRDQAGGPKELAARIRALLRRVQLHGLALPKPVTFGDLELRREQGVVLKRGEELRSPRPSSCCCASSPTTPAWCCPATSCSSGSGATTTWATPAWSTPTSAACG